MSYLLGIDVGTTSIKCALYDVERGVEKAIYSSRVSLYSPQEGWAEQDMLEIWKKTCRLLSQLTKHFNPEDIISIGLSGQSSGLWLVDKKLMPVRMGITWLDLRGKEVITDLSEEQLQKLYDITCWKIFPGSGPILLKWIHDNESSSFKKVKYVLRCKDWVRLKLTDIVCSDFTDMIGFVDPKRMQYSEEVFEILGLDKSYIDLLPQLKSSWNVIGEVSMQAAKETGLKAGTPVVCGAYDVCSSALGAGVIEEGQFFLILGTAGIYASVSKSIMRDPSRIVSINAHTVPGAYIMNSQSMLATPILDWFINEFCKDLKTSAQKTTSVYDLCDESVRNVKRGVSGLIFLPFLQGEMSPFMNPRARGVIFGISLTSSRDEFLRSIYEAIGFSALDNISYLSRLLRIVPKSITVIGGGARSKVWPQILADIMGSKIIIPKGKEFGCRGAAINAGVGIGIYKNHKEGLTRFYGIGREIYPNEKKTKIYRSYFSLYRKLYRTIWSLWDELEKVNKLVQSHHN